MNKVFLTGNLTKDPELTTTANGISVCKFSVAVQRRFAKENGEKEVDFLNIVAWRGIADNCNKYLKKGSKVGIVGSIQTRSYEGNDGVKRFVTEIIADEVEFLTTKNNSEEKKTEPKQEPEQTHFFTPINDDDLPF